MRSNRTLVFGIGVNDLSYPVTEYKKEGGKTIQTWICPFYACWKYMLDRSYNPKRNNSAYEDASVCNSWHFASNFKAWMETQRWKGKHLDKDILVVEGNKEYGPNFCVFISRELNLFLTDRKNFRGSWPIGVHFHKPSQKFISQLRHGGTQINLGSYDTPEEAHAIWKEGKLRLTVELAAKESDARIKLALLSKYRDGGCN